MSSRKPSSTFFRSCCVWGKTYPDRGSYWTHKHWEWLETLDLQDGYLNYSLKSYMQDIKDFENKIQMMDSMIEQIATTDERYKDKVGKLMCFTGVETYTALSIVCEIGDFDRFPDTKSFSSYIGFVPGQDSSGLRSTTNTRAYWKGGQGRVLKSLPMLTNAGEG